MWSVITLNDTLQITSEQGFPAELNLETHLATPYTTSDVFWKVFSFREKQKIRVYQQVPVRNFLVQNIDGKRVYRGLIHILSLDQDYDKKITSWTFTIIHLNSPEEMKMAHRLIDRNKQTDYFGVIE